MGVTQGRGVSEVIRSSDVLDIHRIHRMTKLEETSKIINMSSIGEGQVELSCWGLHDPSGAQSCLMSPSPLSPNASPGLTDFHCTGGFPSPLQLTFLLKPSTPVTPPWMGLGPLNS